MRTPFVFSISAHVAVVAATLIAWPSSREIMPPVDVIMVDTYTISDDTRLPPMPEAEEASLEDLSEVEPDPEPVAETPPPEEEAEPEPAPEPEEVMKKPDSKAKKLPVPAAKSKPKLEPKEFNISRLEDMLLKDKSKKNTAKPQAMPKTKLSATGDITLSERDALLAQMERCWRAPVGAPNPEELIVTIRIQLTQDGRLMGPPEVVENLNSRTNDPFYRLAVENARRAVLMCQPYKLPADKYASWRDLTFNFNPRDMVGM